jgi:hypothetical protein
VKKSGLIFVLFIILSFCQAQRSEMGALAGASFYFGDLNNIPFRNAKFAGGLVYRYNFTPRIALKTSALFGKLAASDETNHSLRKIKDSNGKPLFDANGNQLYFWDYKERKLAFTSPVSEISAQLEINFFNLYNIGHKNQISPYLFGGIAFFSFNPQGQYAVLQDDATIRYETYDLQPMGTEGQGRVIIDEDGNEKQMPNKYSLTGFAIPFGIGFKANIGRYVCVGAEWGLRYTFTKYLDDVGSSYWNPTTDKDYKNIDSESKRIVEYFSDPAETKHTYGAQRCSTNKNDWYSFAGIIITIRIGNEDRICDIKTNVKLKHKRAVKW